MAWLCCRGALERWESSLHSQALCFLGLKSYCYTWKMVRTVSPTTKMSFCDADLITGGSCGWRLPLYGTHMATKGHGTVPNPTRVLMLQY